jgi:MoxR-like ATPase
MGDGVPDVGAVLSPDELLRLHRAAGQVYVDPAVTDYAVRLVLATRRPEALAVDEVAPYVAYGASPRASLGLVTAARALALLSGRAFALPEDVAALAPDLLRHRLVLSYEALAGGIGADELIGRVLAQVPTVVAPPAERIVRRGR